jgi:hypothetical protein
MTWARRVGAIALCVGVVVGIAGRLNGHLDLPQLMSGLSQTTERASGGDGTNQAASSLSEEVEQAARLTAAEDLMSARVAAVEDRSKSSWMTTLDLPDQDFRNGQSRAFDNLVRLPLGEFSYGAVRLAPALTQAQAREAGPKAWAATVTGTYSLKGYDRAPQSFEATFTFVRRPGGWRIADDVTPLQLWDLPGLRVVRGKSVIVVGNAPEARMREYSSTADSAVGRVNEVWGKDWSSHVVIETPSTKEEFARLLLRSADKGLDQVAAITQGVIEPGQGAQADRVVINPKAFTALQSLGRRVVITHELTHVAARSSTTSPVPIWLTEGMADYVGYSGLDLPRERLAAELLTLIREGKGPTVLPKEVDFDPSRTKIAPSYSASWLAVSRLVDLYGEAKVVRFYRVVASGTTVPGAVPLAPDTAAAAAFPHSFGVTEAHFVDGWRHYLRTLALTRR